MRPGLPAVVAATGDWSCTGAVSCTVTGLDAGGVADLVLTIGLSPTAPASLTFAPVVSAPPGANVTSDPITITVGQVNGLLAAETAHGAVQAIGNTVLTCAGSNSCPLADQFGAQTNDHNNYEMAYVNTAGGQFNSSSADLALAGTVSRAFLVWGGDTTDGDASAPNPAARGAVVLSVIPRTPAARAGIVGPVREVETKYPDICPGEAGGDLITAIDGQPVTSFDDVLVYLQRYTAPGTQITLSVLRDGEPRDVSVTLASRPMR